MIPFKIDPVVWMLTLINGWQLWTVGGTEKVLHCLVAAARWLSLDYWPRFGIKGCNSGDRINSALPLWFSCWSHAFGKVTFTSAETAPSLHSFFCREGKRKAALLASPLPVTLPACSLETRSDLGVKGFVSFASHFSPPPRQGWAWRARFLRGMCKAHGLKCLGPLVLSLVVG